MVKLSNNEKVEAVPLAKKNGWKVLLILLVARAVFLIASVAGLLVTGKYNFGLLVFSVATAVLAVILIVYLAIYNSRRKKRA